MPRLKPQTLFLLKGSTALILLLSLWWFLLLPPMTAGLRGAAGLFLTVQETPTGDWSLEVPMEGIIPAGPDHPAQQIHSLSFDLAHGDFIAFTFSLPVFWAVMLAAPGLRRSARAFALGTLIMAAIEVCMLLVFTRIAAGNAAAQLLGDSGETGRWFRKTAEYLIMSVLPFATPFVVALSTHTELRRSIFAWSLEAVRNAGQAKPAAPEARGTKSSRKKR